MKRLLVFACFFVDIAFGMHEENFFHITSLIAAGKDAEVAKFCESAAYIDLGNFTSDEKREKMQRLLKVLNDCSLSKTNPDLHKKIKDDTEFMELCMCGIKKTAQRICQKNLLDGSNSSNAEFQN